MFRTELTIAPAAQQLSRTAKVLTIGSCFADSMGSRLTENKVSTLANPFGTVFQPLALAQLLRAAAGEDVDWQQHVVEARGRWQSLDLHSSIGADSPVELLQTIGEKVYNAGTFLRQADVVVLTLGTAWAYRSLVSGELVNNCQKLPAERFEKELLTPDDIINALAETHAYLRRLNPKLRFVLTVSPVRHLKDTLPLNAVSKSVLRVACHYLSELLPDVSYFPAYELLTDDLRDYRFYAADMLHPTEVAEDYVWDKFTRTYFDADFGRFRKEWSAVRQALAHRPLHDAALEHRQFLESTRERLEHLAAQGVPVGYELADVQQRVGALPEPLAAAAALSEPEDDGQERIDSDDRPERGAVTIPAPALPVIEPEGRAPRTGRSRGGRNRNGRTRDEAEVREVLPIEMGAGVIDFVELAPPTDTKADTNATPAVAPAVIDETEESEYPAKKKKRRSRGGAKRTARKHAALAGTATAPDGMVADQTPGQAALLPGIPAASASGAEDAGIAATADAMDGTPQGQVGEAEPRKSSVITKSVQVKRGGRNRRGGRGETPLTADTTDAAASVTLPVPAALLPPVAPAAAELAAATPEAGPAATPSAPAQISLAEQVLGLKPKSRLSLSEMYGEPRPAAPAAVPRWQRPVQPAKVRPQAATTATPAAELIATPTTAPIVTEQPVAEQTSATTATPAPRRKPAGKAKPATPTLTAAPAPAAGSKQLAAALPGAAAISAKPTTTGQNQPKAAAGSPAKATGTPNVKPGKATRPKVTVDATSSVAVAASALPIAAATPAATATTPKKAAAPKLPAPTKAATLAVKAPVAKTPAQAPAASAPAAAKKAPAAAKKAPATAKKAPAAATAAAASIKPAPKAAPKPVAKPATAVTPAPAAAKAKKAPAAAPKAPTEAPKKQPAAPKAAASTPKPAPTAPKTATTPAKASASAAKTTAATPKAATPAAKAKPGAPKAPVTAATGKKTAAPKAPPKAQ